MRYTINNLMPKDRIYIAYTDDHTVVVNELVGVLGSKVFDVEQDRRFIVRVRQEYMEGCEWMDKLSEPKSYTPDRAIDPLRVPVREKKPFWPGLWGTGDEH